jgi:hypothetical protein
VVSRCSTTGYRPAPLAGVRFHLVWFPAVSLVPSSTAGYRLSSLRDEVGEGREPCGEMVAGGDGEDRTVRTDLASMRRDGRRRGWRR